jgi:hypothetical protein
MALFVSALFDLARHEGNRRRRSVEEYLVLGRRLMTSNVDVHVYVEPQLVDRVRELATGRPASLRTVIEPMALHELPKWGDAETARLALVDGTMVSTSSTMNVDKDTPSACALWWSKADLVHRAMSHAGHESAWWIDFGIAHASTWPDGGLESLGEATRLSFGVVADMPPSTSTSDFSVENFLRSGVPASTGGLIGVPRELGSFFRDRLDDELRRALDLGLLVNDESLYSLLLDDNSVESRRTTWSTLLTDFVRETMKVVEPARVASRVDATPLVDDQYEVVRRVPLPDPLDDRLRSMNPSICRHPESGFVCLVREVNYRYVNGRYVRTDGSDVIKTTYRVLRLNDELAVIDSWPLDDTFVRSEAPVFPVHGVEDLRLFRARDAWWASGTIRQHRSDGVCQIMLLRLEGMDDGEPRVVGGRLLPSLSVGRHEKNWMPIEGESPAWMWSANPAVILRLDEVTGTLVPNRAARGEITLRGGSQVIRRGDGWLAVVHDVRPRDTRHGRMNEYRHRFVRWDQTFTTSWISEPFRLGDDELGLEFCAGLATGPSDSVVLSTGIADDRAELIVCRPPREWRD